LRAFYDRFYRISDDEKISDTVIIFRVIVTAVIILSCLAAMTFSAYAYYEYDLLIRIEKIQSAVFGANISVKDSSGKDIEVESSPDYYRVELKKGGEYTVKISRVPASTAETGFCRVRLFNSESYKDIYYTVQLESDDVRKEVTFIIKPSTDCKMKITPNWGTSLYYADNDNPKYITQGKVIDFPQIPVP